MKQIKVTILVLLVVIAISICLIPYLSRALHKDDWKTKTTPLPKETIDILCERFGLSSQDKLCKENNDVYGPDFFPMIRNAFPSIPVSETDKAASFEEVEQKLGDFRYECEPVVHQSDGDSYFVCYYDLRGDREFIMAIVYRDPDKKVLHINGTSLFGE